MCQHLYLSELGCESKYNNILNYFIIHYVFKFTKIKRSILKKIHAKRFANRLEATCISKDQIKAGDIVRVLSKEEIDSTLNYDGRYKKCQFMDEMYKYCGGEFKVLKTVNYFYEKGIEKVCKCKDVFLLEGLTCRGKKGLPIEVCNFNCYFFWHDAWVAKKNNLE